eukprot:878539_1
MGIATSTRKTPQTLANVIERYYITPIKQALVHKPSFKRYNNTPTLSYYPSYVSPPSLTRLLSTHPPLTSNQCIANIERDITHTNNISKYSMVSPSKKRTRRPITMSNESEYADPPHKKRRLNTKPSHTSTSNASLSTSNPTHIKAPSSSTLNLTKHKAQTTHPFTSNSKHIKVVATASTIQTSRSRSISTLNPFKSKTCRRRIQPQKQQQHYNVPQRRHIRSHSQYHDVSYHQNPPLPRQTRLVVPVIPTQQQQQQPLQPPESLPSRAQHVSGYHHHAGRVSHRPHRSMSTATHINMQPPCPPFSVSQSRQTFHFVSHPHVVPMNPSSISTRNMTQPQQDIVSISTNISVNTSTASASCNKAHPLPSVPDSNTMHPTVSNNNKASTKDNINTKTSV